ncbi:DUF5710 domain-containing protein [Halomonas sp. 328]|uniref:DUF5710 domain-containing protein n=1 Tax=Halomonas sp. 328 TaxID=2776704 RepID=UPI0018A724F2|nr:DUF5710 domain-containing protein [Halomonas sp. 328]MBF8224531.1 conjugal transfer protein TraC [Halomonas sp. 328]
MSRTDLKVPFSEKDEAKRLGARWDPENKVWYVPEGKDPSGFMKWLPDIPDYNIRAACYQIAESEKLCWKCGASTKVIGFLLPEGFEYVEPLDPEDAGFGPSDEYTEEELQAWLKSENSVEWCYIDSPTYPFFITELPNTVSDEARKISSNYRRNYSKQAGESYWMNHCQSCGMKQGDFAMHQEPSGVFFPFNGSEAERITLHPIHSQFLCSGDFSIRSEMFIEFMKSSDATTPEVSRQQGILGRLSRIFSGSSR